MASVPQPSIGSVRQELYRRMDRHNLAPLWEVLEELPLYATAEEICEAVESLTEAELGRKLPLTDDARAALVASADGDGRFLLNQVETLFDVELTEPLDPAGLAALLHRRVAVYDKDREGHYNLISALHKAIRGSDPQAALYYLARMLTAGEEPLYLLRRLTRAAVEDIGLADPQALVQCIAAKDSYDFLGSPEGELAIVQACLYLATAPKSNAAYMAQKAAWQSASLNDFLRYCSYSASDGKDWLDTPVPPSAPERRHTHASAVV